jgi:TfoX/Sxy family transcriptional regulator of competence genes
MCDWWGVAAELDPRPGGTCRVELGGGPVMVGEYLELIPHNASRRCRGPSRTRGTPTVNVPKPSDADRSRFEALVPDASGVEVRPMFGNLGAFQNGHMFMGLFGSDIGVKLPADERAALLAQPGAGPFGPEGRPMGGYATLPAEWTAREAAPWIERSLRAATALPPKAPKKKGPREVGTERHR